MDYVYFLIIALFGSMISAVFGFGSGFIVLSFGAFLLPLKDCIALTSILFAAATLTKAFLYRKEIDWELAMTIALVSVPFAWLGAEALARIDPEPLRPLLAGFIIFSAGVNLTGYRVTLPSTFLVTFLVSALYGFVSGFLSSGNPVKAVAMEKMGFERQAFIGVMAATGIGVNLTKISSYADNGILQPDHLPVGLALFVIAIITAVLGKRLVLKMPGEQHKKGLSFILLIAAGALLFK
ncbi:sulfite exporter TauE/SafE family protein [Kiloniella laminariae]|uniref:Probable membrane transporter protein n=1 Tax=Kiloniella laminariae TaxID=454162 RepID=A0ABT4LIH1_9PROT|nr:sulfite exporter TauE/SafE family protein [Kiloniella laminariae]MCZ4280881.1 sulfite exporter TauE/SafE family protein [Kiloniella laminariae]